MRRLDRALIQKKHFPPIYHLPRRPFDGQLPPTLVAQQMSPQLMTVCQMFEK